MWARTEMKEAAANNSHQSRNKWQNGGCAYRMFVINCKNYMEVSKSKEIAGLIGSARRVARKYKVEIVVAPPQYLIGLGAEHAAKRVGGGVSIFAQHVDCAEPGGTTGFMVPELLRESGVAGSLVNHSEHRIPGSQVRETVARLDRLGMTSIVCVRSVAEAKKYAALKPDYIAIEPPELIGSGRAVSRERPDLIEKAATTVLDSGGGRTRLLCGAGIVSGEDVARAVQLGSAGILVASGIVKASDWGRTMAEFAGSMA